jgi:hypothetical protein
MSGNPFMDMFKTDDQLRQDYYDEQAANKNASNKAGFRSSGEISGSYYGDMLKELNTAKAAGLTRVQGSFGGANRSARADIEQALSGMGDTGTTAAMKASLQAKAESENADKLAGAYNDLNANYTNSLSGIKKDALGLELNAATTREEQLKADQATQRQMWMGLAGLGGQAAGTAVKAFTGGLA